MCVLSSSTSNWHTQPISHIKRIPFLTSLSLQNKILFSNNHEMIMRKKKDIQKRDAEKMKDFLFSLVELGV